VKNKGACFTPENACQSRKLRDAAAGREEAYRSAALIDENMG